MFETCNNLAFITCICKKAMGSEARNPVQAFHAYSTMHIYILLTVNGYVASLCWKQRDTKMSLFMFGGGRSTADPFSLSLQQVNHLDLITSSSPETPRRTAIINVCLVFSSTNDR